jgi:hypothetical protein
MWKNYMQRVKRLMKDSWEAKTCSENRKPANPLVISHEETSGGESDSDDCARSI